MSRASERTPPATSALVAGTASALAVFAVAAIIAARGAPAQWELDLFETVNGLPDWLYVFVWPFMQYGVFITIPIAALLAWGFHRRRLSVMLAAGGLGIYVLARLVKQLVERGRPGAFFEALNEREEFAAGSLGFTSGHAAVAGTIATLTYFHLPRPWRRASVAVVFVVMFGRMYVGAHLAIDLVGGVAMGIAAGLVSMLIARLASMRR